MEFVLIAIKEGGTEVEGNAAHNALKTVIPKPRFQDFGASPFGKNDVVMDRNRVMVFADFSASNGFTAKDKAARLMKRAKLDDFEFDVEGKI